MRREGSPGAAGALAVLVAVADQLSKAWAAATLPPAARPVIVISGWLWFRLLRNTGASFSLLQEHNILFAVATLIVLAAIAVIIQRGYVAGRLSVLALGAIAGGACGNLVDRLRIGGVVDFIQVRGWPTDFNLADVSIRLGVLAFIAGLILERMGAGRRARRVRNPTGDQI